MFAIDYRDVEIHIRPENADGTFPVTIRVEDEDRRADGIFRMPFGAAEVDRALLWMEQGLFDTSYVKEFGQQLFETLFTGKLRQVYDGTRESGTPLRFRLILDSAVIARIPWELLYDPDRSVFPALEGPLVRGTNLVAATRPLQATPPLRLLVIDAFPRGVLKVQDQAETEGIRKALANLSRSGDIEVVALSHATLAKLQDALRESARSARQQPFHVLHFIGHGRYDTVSGRTVLLFEDDQGEIDEVDAETLTNIVRPYDLKLVFLNACQSLQSSALDLTRGFAPALLASGIPCVIGMQVTVLDELAVQFSRNFYESLADNQPADAALADARRLARGSRNRRKADLGIPVCYLRTTTGQILELQRPRSVPLTRQTWRPWIQSRFAAMVTGWNAIFYAAGIILVVAGMYELIIVGIVLPWFDDPPKMNGDLNIAFAEFGELRDDKVHRSTEAADLSQDAFKLFIDEITSISDTIESMDPATSTKQLPEVRSPADTGRIGGSTIEQRADEAEDLAGRINADIIVYGNLQRGDKRVVLVPEFYISDRVLQDAEELVGQYELGSAIREFSAAGDIRDVARPLRDQLLGRIRALALFTYGVWYYKDDEFDKAARYFEEAEQTGDWDNPVLYQFLGNTAGHRGDLGAAEWFYRRALDKDPEYARAHLGMAELLFQRSKGRTCEEHPVSVEGLYGAIDLYRAVLVAENQPASSAITAKVALRVGNIYLCLSLSGVADHFAEAERELRAVIAEFDAGNKYAKDLAAEAYGSLGLVAAPIEGDPDAQTKYRAATEMFRQAIKLTQHQAREAHFWRMLGYMYERLGEGDQAAEAYAEATALAMDIPTPQPIEDGDRQPASLETVTP